MQNTSAPSKRNKIIPDRRQITAPNEILFQTFHQNSQVHSVDLNEKLDFLLLNNEALNQRLSKQMEDSQIMYQSSCLLGIDFEQLFSRMETLENMIETQHMQITLLKQKSGSTEKENNLIATFIEKNEVYQEMIFQQQQEIENYRRIVEINANLQKENSALQIRIRQLESQVEEYQFNKIEIENKVYDIIELNKSLQEKIEHQMTDQSKHEDITIKHIAKDSEIKELLSIIKDLKVNIKAKSSQEKSFTSFENQEGKQIKTNRTTFSSEISNSKASKLNQLQLSIPSIPAYKTQTLALTERNYPIKGIDLNESVKKITNTNAKLIQRV